MRNIYPLDSRFTLPFLFVLVISLLFMLPGGILQAQTSDDNFEYAENGTDPVATFTAMDPEQTAIASWSLAGTDEGDFDIDGGVLTFKESPNFEDPADGDGQDGDNTYEVTVQATDSTMKMGMKEITVTVTNVNELGTVTLSALRPQSATPFTATLTDLDNPDPTTITGTTWQWAKASSRNGTYSDIEDATSAMYSPKDEDVNSYLRATASYTDGQDRDKSAMARSQYAVQAVRGNNEPPEFPDQDPSTPDIDDTATRMVPENTPAGMAIGNPVAATDGNNDVLTYTLGGTGAASFDINRATGQLMTKAALNVEDEPSYTVTVRATDASGVPPAPTVTNPETANTAQITVNITVTNLDEPPVVDGDAEVTFQEVTGDIDTDLDDYNADDPETGGIGNNDDSVVTWSLTGADAGKFNIDEDDGALNFMAKPDFEAQGDANGDNVYEVTVTATDDTGNRGTLAVEVTVANENEDGEVTLSRTQPRVGIPVRATLTDPDGSISGLTWQWYSGQNEIAEATSDTYIPTEADFTNTVTLRVVASYTDGQGTNKSAEGPAANSVAEDTRNRAPIFNDQDLLPDVIENESATRMVAEDAEAMAVVGRPVTANDPDPNTDALIYTLSGADAGLFIVDQDASTSPDADEGGQIRVGANTRLDYETRNGYMVTVTAEDSFGASCFHTCDHQGYRCQRRSGRNRRCHRRISGERHGSGRESTLRWIRRRQQSSPGRLLAPTRMISISMVACSPSKSRPTPKWRWTVIPTTYMK